jgi:hypothetical protein
MQRLQSILAGAAALVVLGAIAAPARADAPASFEAAKAQAAQLKLPVLVKFESEG